MPPTDGTQSSNSGDVARVNVLVDDQGNPERYVVVLTNSNGNEQWRIDTVGEPNTLISNEERTRPADNNRFWNAILRKDLDNGQVRVLLVPIRDFVGLDYASFGRWGFVPDSALAADYVAGFFVDSSDPFENGNLQALVGSATYEGGVTGEAWVAGEGSRENLGGLVRLTADFGDASKRGTVRGTIDQVENEDTGEFYGNRFMLMLGQADIDSGGAFNGDLTGRFVLSDGTRTLTIDGKWGGTFHGNGADDSEKPLSILGTFGGRFGDTDSVFTGFLAAVRRQ